MERLGPALKTLLTFGLVLHIHHKFHGPPFDYWALAAAAAASWVGVPGPGEPVLIAAGVLAARHKLDLGSVLLVAWAGATAGGIVGWVIGLRAGRRFLAAAGPLRRLRQSALERGDKFFDRYAVVGVLLAPSWVAGIHRVRTRIYLPLNALGAALWAGGIGLGAYFVGPPVVEFVGDLGTATVLVLVLLVIGGVTAEILRRRRKHRDRV